MGWNLVLAVARHGHQRRELDLGRQHVEELVTLPEPHGEAHNRVGDRAPLHLLLSHPAGVQVGDGGVWACPDDANVDDSPDVGRSDGLQQIPGPIVIDTPEGQTAPLAYNGHQMDYRLDTLASAGQRLRVKNVPLDYLGVERREHRSV